jgi:hypothetical protein
MTFRYFNKNQLSILGEAIEIAEDMTSNYFRLSLSQWQSHPFEVKTFSNLNLDIIKDDAFALLKRYEKENGEKQGQQNKIRQFYIIFLQDNQILKAIQRDRKLKLLPLLAYIITHELVHIVRFCKFQVMFDTQQKDKRIKEEKIVHKTTNEILRGLSLPNLPYILGSYKPDKINMDVCV